MNTINILLSMTSITLIMQKYAIQAHKRVNICTENFCEYKYKNADIILPAENRNLRYYDANAYTNGVIFKNNDK